MADKKHPSIQGARSIGMDCNADLVAIVTLDAGLNYSITTWGRTHAACASLARWAESTEATQTLEDIANKLPTAGIIDVALEPDVGREDAARKDLLTEINEMVTLEKGFNGDALANRIYDLMRKHDEEYRNG